MNPLAAAPEPTVPRSEPTLEDFFDALRRRNPFLANRVVAPDAGEVHAGAVHQRELERLQELARQATGRVPGIGVVLWGEAGIGKSHVLSQLGRWAEGRAVFIYLQNLQASPEAMPRSLLRATMSILTRARSGQFHATPLYRLVEGALIRALGEGRGQPVTWPVVAHAYRRRLETVAAHPGRAAHLDQTVYQVLFDFYQAAYRQVRGTDDGANAALAVRWLSGGELDPAEGERLGLAPGDRARADDQRVKNVLIALAELASCRGGPFVLALDQMDNLDADRLQALARFLHALLDGAGNLLVVTAGVKDTLFRFRQDRTIPEAAWDRLGQFEVLLWRIAPAEARQLVQVRLEPFLQPFLPGLDAVKQRVQEDCLFPLGERWFTDCLGDKVEVRPRDVLTWARSGWQAQQESLRRLGAAGWLEEWNEHVLRPSLDGSAAVSAAALLERRIAQKLEEAKAQRHREPETLPADRDHLAGLLLSVLRLTQQANSSRILEVEAVEPRPGRKAVLDLKLLHRGTGQDDTHTGVLVLVEESRVALAGYLRRLTQLVPRPDRLFVIGDERCPIDPGDAGLVYLADLQETYGDRLRLVTLSFEEYVSLDALTAVVGLARSGDLEIEGPDGGTHAVSEAEAVQTLGRLGAIVGHPLLGEILR